MADDSSRAIVEAAAKQYGVDPNYMHTTRSHESGNFDYSTGKFPADETEFSRHKGPFQLTTNEFNVYGPKGGNIYDLKDASLAMAAKTKAEMGAFSKKYNREPTGDDLYMIHNQGSGGYDAHLANPEGIAWRNVARFYPNEAIAKSAIWGNIPDDVKRARGWSTGKNVTDDVNKVTSGDLINIWKNKRAGASQTDNSLYHPYQAQPQQGQPAQVPQGATAQYQQPGFLSRSADAVSRIPADAQNYYNNSPSLRDQGWSPQNVFVNGPNAILDSAINTISGGRYGLASPLRAMGLPTDGLQNGINEFRGVPPRIPQAVTDASQFIGSAPGLPSGEQTSAAVSRGTQLAKETARNGVAAFEDAAAAAGNPARSNIFVGVPPGQLYDRAAAMRRSGATPTQVYNRTGKEAIISPSGRIVKEIPSSDARVSDLSRFNDHDIVPIDKVYDHPELFENYPELKNRNVRFEPNGNGRLVENDRKTNDIVINSDHPALGQLSGRNIVKSEISKLLQYTADRSSREAPEAFGHSYSDMAKHVAESIKRVEKFGEKAEEPLAKAAADAYVDQHKRIMNDVLNSRAYIDKPGENHILRQSREYMSQKAKGVPEDKIKFTEGQWRNIAGQYLHDINGGNVMAMTTANRSIKPNAGLYPFTGGKSMDKLVFPFNRKLNNDEVESFLTSWYDLGPGREPAVRKPAPTGYAGGGKVVAEENDYRIHFGSRLPGYADGGGVSWQAASGRAGQAPGAASRPGDVNQLGMPAGGPSWANIPNGGGTPTWTGNAGREGPSQGPAQGNRGQNQSPWMMYGATSGQNTGGGRSYNPWNPLSSLNPFGSGGLFGGGHHGSNAVTSFSTSFTPISGGAGGTGGGSMGGYSPPQVNNPYQWQPSPGNAANYAEGGQVSYDGYRHGGRARRPLHFPGAVHDPIHDRISANVGASEGLYGGLTPPPLGQQPQQQNYADGGEVTDSPGGDAHIDGDGMVRDPSESGVTTDQISARVPEDSHIIPYNALVKLGDGDPELGKQRLLEYIKHLTDAASEEKEETGGEKEKNTQEMKKGGKPQSKNKKSVDIMISNRELVLTPDKVKKIGGGDINVGHHELNKMRMKLRGAK